MIKTLQELVVSHHLQIATDAQTHKVLMCVFHAKRQKGIHFSLCVHTKHPFKMTDGFGLFFSGAASNASHARFFHKMFADKSN